MKKRSLFRTMVASQAVVGICSAAFGAAVAICFSEVPVLRTAEAAAWASAIATTAAVFAALYVGLAPEKARREASRRRAWAMAQWAEGALGTQLVHLRNAIEYMREPILYSNGRSTVIHELKVLDSGPVKALIDHFDALDPVAIRSAGRCVIDMDRGIQTMRNLERIPPESGLDMDGVRDIFLDVYMSMDDAREVFAKIVYGNSQKIDEPVEVAIARVKAAGEDR